MLETGLCKLLDGWLNLSTVTDFESTVLLTLNIFMLVDMKSILSPLQKDSTIRRCCETDHIHI